MPLVSVVIPCHNLAGYLGDAVASALAQTLPDIEVVVVDDASSQDLEPAFSAYLHDRRLRMLRLATKGGPAAARNAGLRSQSSAFVAFLDADDQWLPRKLQAQVETLADAGLAGCTSGSFTILQLEAQRVNRAPLNRADDLYGRLLRGNVFGNPSSVLLRRSCFEEAHGFDESLPGHEDHDLWSRLARSRRLAATPMPLAVVRRDRPDHRIWNVPRMARASEAFLRARTRDVPAPTPRQLARARVVHAVRLAWMARQSANRSLCAGYSARAVWLALQPLAFGFRLRDGLALLGQSLGRLAGTEAGRALRPNRSQRRRPAGEERGKERGQ